jgi:hypothetical protein
VLFNDEDGNPLPYPIVMVVLQPSGTTLPCRVASSVAGSGEGAWYPFVGGDEVIVVIPQGHTRAGATIVGRLNQQLDAFPRLVAGQDSTKNNFGFRRTTAPHVEETAGGYVIRSSTTGAFLGIDSAGHVTVADGDAAQLHLGADFLGLSTADNSCTLQLNPSDQSAFVQGGATQLLLNGAGVTLLTPGNVQLATSGAQPSGHGVTAEQVLALLVQLCTITAGPLTGAGIISTLPQAIAACATVSGVLPAPVLAALLTAMAVPPLVPPVWPGYGIPGLLF